VQLVVSDTGPINYLVLIGHIDVLPLLFEKIVMPPAVRDELMDPNAPLPVREWIARLPAWLEIGELPAQSFDDDLLAGLGKGEREAIILAAALHADLLLMDDREGMRAALRKELDTTGTRFLTIARHSRGYVIPLYFRTSRIFSKIASILFFGKRICPSP
jgi:predicted nucleic acid-binding protein